MWTLLPLLAFYGQLVPAVHGVVVCDLPSDCPSKTQKYLTDFGYLDPHRPECTNEDIEAALTKFQELNNGFKGLHVTGRCDNKTRFVMNQPRCGCEDIVKGNETKMMKNTIKYVVDPLAPQEFRTGNTKWGSRTLTWFVEKYPIKNRHLSQAQVDDAMRRGLQIWADKTKLSFRRITSSSADIVIRFETHRHTRSPPYFDFDGQGNVLAHAFFPESGLVHFDDDEHFVLGSDSGTELYIVAAHEFGHTLGISHSNIKEALMAPYYRYSKNLQLHPDDIAAIQSLYGPPDADPRHTTPAPIPTPRPTPPKPSPELPDFCNIQVQASFSIDGTTYLFSRETNGWRRIMKVYTLASDGITPQGREVKDVFLKSSSSSYRYRSYPLRVDAATYIPNKQYVLLFQGTKVYAYKKNGDVFYLDRENNYPRWFDTSDFPELPRAAVAMPYYGYSNYYVLIFGSTMVWNWDVNRHRVGAWAYPIDAFGRNMPQKVDAAYLQDRNWAIFIKGDKYWRFSILSRRVLEEDSKLPLKKDLFKGLCM